MYPIQPYLELYDPYFFVMQMERNRTRQLLRTVNNMYATVQGGSLKAQSSKRNSIVGWCSVLLCSSVHSGCNTQAPYS